MYMQFQTPPVFPKQHYADGLSMGPAAPAGKTIIADKKMQEAALTLLSVSPNLTGIPARAPLETLCSVANAAEAKANVGGFSLGPAQPKKEGVVVSKGSLWNGGRFSAAAAKKTKTTYTKKPKSSQVLKSARRVRVSKSAKQKQPYFPSMLELKYKPFYNKGGRVGIYDKTQRAKLISRWMEKRTKRVWVKKVRYSCRKNLAESRIRVKGRFVKVAK